MPIESIPRIIARIKKAPPGKPISVFVVKHKGNRVLDAIYGNTVAARQRQTALKPYHQSDKCPLCGHITQHLAEEWLGDFHNRMNLEDIRTFLAKAMET